MPVKRREKQILIAPLLILAILAIDQCSKTLIHTKLSIGQSIPLIKNILHITYVGNTGAAFGLFKNGSSIFVIISILAIILISVIIFKKVKAGQFLSRPLFDYGLLLIVSGAIGNLIDRMRFSYVIDFIDVRIWPVFNIADSAITIGTFLLLLSLFPSNKFTFSTTSKM